MIYRLIHADVLDGLRSLPDESVHAIVTDPPYGLEFMGKAWDGADGFRRSLNRADVERENVFGRTSRTSPEYRTTSVFQEWCEAWATEALRVLKPGGHLLSFGGTRTYHRMACAIEDAGFEIRDQIQWLYGSGFPKSLDVSKALDKAAGAEREVLAQSKAVKRMIPGADQNATGSWIKDNGREYVPTVTAPATAHAALWQGWGTALKPANEPCVLARKPLVGTVAANVLEFGTGALNIDGCRIGSGSGGTRDGEASEVRRYADRGATNFAVMPGPRGGDIRGRWPANVILDEEAAAMLDEQSGELTSGNPSGKRNVSGFGGGLGDGKTALTGFGDSGGASRFFYVAKPERGERDEGGVRNVHPTVKPVDLMRYLIRLVTPPGGTVLDPFAGSGSTGMAAIAEGFDFIGIEREGEYIEIARNRIASVAPMFAQEVAS